MGDEAPYEEAVRAGTKADADAGGDYAAAWTAVGAARVRVASLHCCAAWDALGHAWSSISEAAAKTRDSSGALGSAIGRNNAVDLQALAAGAAGMAQGVRLMGTARAAFGAAAKRSLAEASERDMAAGAYDAAGAARAARAQRGRADMARKRGSSADGWESAAAEKLAILTASTAMWKENIAMSASAGVWNGDRVAWAAMHADIRAGVEHDRARWARMARRSAKAGARASDRLARAEAAAKKAVGAAGMEMGAENGKGSAGGAGGVPSTDAADAWLAATRAAEQLSRG